MATLAMTVAVQLPIDYGVFSNSMDVLVVADSSLDTGLPLLYKTIGAARHP